MFITFEGIDLAGKSTQTKLLQEYLIKKNKRVKVVREPGGTYISEKIRDILLDRTNKGMFPMTEFLLFSASRYQLTEEVIKPLLKKKYFVPLHVIHLYKLNMKTPDISYFPFLSSNCEFEKAVISIFKSQNVS